MMTPDMLADKIAEAFSSCRMRSQLSVDALASRTGCDAAVIRKIENSDFDECFKLRENYRDKESVERKMCDEIKLTPSVCIVLDDGIIF
jgi:ribosome-binding protein aMBF1 (putative translation factor)